MESSAEDRPSLQERALAAYVSLTRGAPDWARRLVLLSATAEAGAYALATVAAGAAVLWTCADEAELRRSGLDGLTDFQVTTLSEALRILKNEMRKGLPVSVGVLDMEHEVWSEAERRGVQPEAVLAASHDGPIAAVLLARGAQALVPVPVMHFAYDRAETWRARRDGDQRLLEKLRVLPEPERGIALRWVRAALRLFPRDTFRCYAAAWAASKQDK